MPSAAFRDAYVHYLTKFPDKASLGTGTPPDSWKTELDAVAPLAFDQMKATGVNFEGGSAQFAFSNFDQLEKVRALHAVRAFLDTDYVNPYTQPIPESMPGQRMGSIVRLGCSSAL